MDERKRTLQWLAAGACLLGMAGTAVLAQPEKAQVPPATVASVDLDRYAGRWYEIARFPNRFQKSCAGEVTADYTRREDGRLRVVNRCRRANGSVIEASGVARVAAKDGSNAKLQVRFAPAWLSFLPVWGDYWVLELADDYSHALVGDGGRDYLWILAREPQMDPGTYDDLVARAAAKGFDTARLQRTDQAGGAR